MKSTKRIETTHPKNSLGGQNNGISVIMPAYDVANGILKTLVSVKQILRQITEDYEIIVVNDGSRDETEQVVKSYSRLNPKVKLVSYTQNMGKGHALKKGFVRANKEIVIFLDSDLDIDPRNIEAYGKALKRCDIVIASKRHSSSEFRAPVMRKILSISFNVLVKLFLGIKYSDTQAGLKAFRKKALEKVMRMGLVKGYAFDAELLALASLLNLKVEEAPVKACLSSKFNLKSIIYMLIDLLGIFYRLKIIKWYQNNLNDNDAIYKRARLNEVTF